MGKETKPNSNENTEWLRRKIKIQGGDISQRVMAEAAFFMPGSSLLSLKYRYQQIKICLHVTREQSRQKISQAKHYKGEFVHGWQWAGSVPHTLLRGKCQGRAEHSVHHIWYLPGDGCCICGFATGSSEQTRPVQHFPEQQLQGDHLKLHKALI